MNKFDIRRARLRELIRTQFDGKQSRFAEKIGRPQNYISRVLTTGKNRKNLGEELARHIEKTLRLERYWLDTAAEEQQTKGSGTMNNFEMSPEALALAKQWDQLPSPFRQQIRNLIESLAEKQDVESLAPTARTRPNA